MCKTDIYYVILFFSKNLYFIITLPDDYENIISDSWIISVMN